MLLTLFSSVLWSEEGSVPSDSHEAAKLEMERLEAQIQKQHEEYQKRPKKNPIEIKIRKLQFKNYVDNWRQKITKAGNQNYPIEAKNKLYGSVTVNASIKPDGSLSNVEVLLSSGYPILDNHIVDTVKKSALHLLSNNLHITLNGLN